MTADLVLIEALARTGPARWTPGSSEFGGAIPGKDLLALMHNRFPPWRWAIHRLQKLALHRGGPVLRGKALTR